MKIYVDYWYWDTSKEKKTIVGFNTIILDDEDIKQLIKDKMEDGQLPVPYHMELEKEKYVFDCSIDKTEI